jgi:hypothetical protein
MALSKTPTPNAAIPLCRYLPARPWTCTQRSKKPSNLTCMFPELSKGASHVGLVSGQVVPKAPRKQQQAMHTGTALLQWEVGKQGGVRCALVDAVGAEVVAAGGDCAPVAHVQADGARVARDILGKVSGRSLRTCAHRQQGTHQRACTACDDVCSTATAAPEPATDDGFHSQGLRQIQPEPRSPALRV